MNKWTWPALAALLAVAAGSYYLLSKRQERPAADGPADLDVEAFGDDVEGDEGDNTYEMLDDAHPKDGAASTGPAGTRPDEGVKTIDDDDDMGETVKDPVVIDDEEDGAVEAPQPKK